MNDRVIGVRGRTWRGRVTAHGSVVPDDGSAVLDWFVAADDRWYRPSSEPTLRQKWYAGYPVCETRVRIPGGDMVQRVYAVADLGGLTVMEFENDSPMPVAVAVTRRDVLTTRAPVDNPPMGIDLPPDSIVIPIGHKSTARVALEHDSPTQGRLPDDVANHQQVVRGWETACDVASRINLPDHAIVAGVSRVRSDLLLGTVEADNDAIELVRLGETNADSVLDVVGAVERRMRSERRSKILRWDTPHVFNSAARACALLDEELAAADIGSAWLRIADRPVEELPQQCPLGLEAVAWIETLLASPSPSGGHCVILPFGVPQPWWGASFEAHGLTADPYRTLSYAVRWHGARPALLWEVSGSAGLLLSGGAENESWHSTDQSGETLLSAPAVATSSARQ